MVKIKDVEKPSAAHRRGIRPNDLLVSINGNEICDVLDYRFYLTEEKVELVISRSGKERRIKIKKGEYDDIGLSFESALMDEKQRCKNGCIFCFIDQNPEGMRESIYFKDDDSRLSFLHGNYVTLTNMSEADVARIIKMRISPINISVHTTNPELRVKMMKNKHAGEVLKYLRDFYDAGISMCAQIVLCRGVNDGEELIRSMSDLSQYYPVLSSVSVVPAGLTEHRCGLYPLADFSPEEAGAIIDTVDAFEREKRVGRECLFFAADELYLKAGRNIPSAEYYCGYPQIDNGVGMLRSFMDEFTAALSDMEIETLDRPRCVSVATGAAAYDMMREYSARLMAMEKNLTINVYKINNKFFGESITVAGLLTGRDMYEQLRGRELGEELFISQSTLRSGEEVFLCGMTLAELSEGLGVPVRAIDCDGYSLAEALVGKN